MYEDEIPIGRATDLRGQKFGRLTVLYRVFNGHQRAKWKCKCDCGNIVSVISSSLINGHTQSCGCLMKENLSERMKKQTYGTKKLIDVTNQKFGFLTALYPIQQPSGPVKWKCKCECGNEIEVRSDHLRKLETISCGCAAISLGELKIQQVLQENNIKFTREQKFNTCRFESNYLARFDFYINNQYLIEFDGEQHFKLGSGLFNNENRFIETQQRDAYKNQWCKDNNIPLIRIPYTKLDTLCIEDLLLETTQFRVV